MRPASEASTAGQHPLPERGHQRDRDERAQRAYDANANDAAAIEAPATATPASARPAVAVRSSTTAEKTCRGCRSPASRSRTSNIRGEAAAARRGQCWCWCRLTARAIDYRGSTAASRPSQVSLAVVVQELVPADAAGVMFTAAPGDAAPSRARSTSTAAWGLGEAVVSGQVTPDTLVVDNVANGNVESPELIGDKTVIPCAPQWPARATSRCPSTSSRRAAVLGAERGRDPGPPRGAASRRQCGQPVDVEWAQAGGRFSRLAEGQADAGVRALGARDVGKTASPATILWTNGQPR